MIVVTTPTGQIGHRVVDHLLGNGRPVRVVVRDPARLAAGVRDRVEVVAGSHDDPGVLTRAFDGADTVFWVVPPSPGADSVRELYARFDRAAAAAVSTCGVRRVVGVSTLGRGYPKEAGHLTAALDGERLIEATGVDHRALAMPFFMDNLLVQVDALTNGMFVLPNSGDRELLTVAAVDIAAVAAALLLDDAWSGQERVPVVGPDRLTPRQMAATLSSVLGRDVAFHQVGYADYRAAMTGYGMSDGYAQGLVDMAAAQNDGVYDVEPRDVEAVMPTSFRQWCAEVLKPAVDA